MADERACAEWCAANRSKALKPWVVIGVLGNEEVGGLVSLELQVTTYKLQCYNLRVTSHGARLCSSPSRTAHLHTRAAISRLHLGYISAASRLHLGYISATSRLHLGYISAMSRLYLGCISAVSRP